MNKQPEDWLDDVPENENEDDDEIIWVSKSEIKRDAEALKDPGPKWSIWAKTRWTAFRWTKICVPPSSWRKRSRKRAAAVSCS